MPFYTYLLQCADGTLYCGCTNNLDKRLTEHNGLKKGAKYTKTRRPVKLVYSELFSFKTDALTREREIKKLSRADKFLLFNAV